jgi:hypothetical protein
MGADSFDDQPLVTLDAGVVRLRKAQTRAVAGLGLGDFRCGAMRNEDGNSVQPHGNSLAGLDRCQVNLDSALRQNILGRVHAIDKGPQCKARTGSGKRAGG